MEGTGEKEKKLKELLTRLYRKNYLEKSELLYLLENITYRNAGRSSPMPGNLGSRPTGESIPPGGGGVLQLLPEQLLVLRDQEGQCKG